MSEVSSHLSLMPDRTRQDSHMSDMQVSDIKSQETQQVKMHQKKLSHKVITHLRWGLILTLFGLLHPSLMLTLHLLAVVEIVQPWWRKFLS